MSPKRVAEIDEELQPPFRIEMPDVWRGPFIFNSPHSGRVYPQAFIDASRLTPLALRKSEDAFVEALFETVVSLGLPLMHAQFPRAYLDVNREPYELDPALISETLPRYANTQSVRVVGGLGTIARIVTESEEIYREPVSLGDALARINQLYKPYHAGLESLIAEGERHFGCAVLIDCHSMPSGPLADQGGQRPDFVLGDRFGTSCEPELIRFVGQRLEALGYAVAHNKPYAGGYITEHYGQPGAGRHALQIEVNRSLYMDEAKFEKLPRFDDLSRDLAIVAGELIEAAPALLEVPRAAAE